MWYAVTSNGQLKTTYWRYMARRQPKLEALDHRMGFEFVASFLEGFAASGAGKYRALSEREWLERALQFANADSTASLGALLSGSDVAANDPREDKEFRTIIAPGEHITHVELLDRIAPGLRSSFGSVCEAIVAGKRPALWLLPDPSDRVAMVCRFCPTADGASVETSVRILPVDLQTSFALASNLLVSADRPYGHELCRCQLPSCQRFFFVHQDQSGGQPRRKYCIPEHMRELHRLQTAERVRRYRERLKKARKSK